MKHMSLGVIGHVDHGKTSLVRALTGIDTDRLKEEKERGMSIVLGFACIESAQGVIDLIDVPGHENFVHTMIAGATGIDAALLTVDVHEGVKPQTAEHLAITQLIGIRRGVIAITKCDTADDATRAQAVARLRSLLRGSYLDGAPVVFTSARSGEGLAELRSELLHLLAARAEPPMAAQWYLPVDRAFSMAGCGTVVTGTLRMGSLQVGDEVEILPGSRRATVRQLQFHRQSVERLLPGQRAGVNLRGLRLEEVSRGDTLAAPGLLRAATLLDVHLSLLPGCDKPLRDGQAVRLLFAASEVPAQVRLLCGLELAPGDSGIAQLRTMREVAASIGEPFILRNEAPPQTIGGGRFLDPVAPRHRRSDQTALARLHVLAQGSHEEVARERLKAAGYAGIALADLAAACGLSYTQLSAVLNAVTIFMIDDRKAIYRPFLDALGDMICAALRRFHEQYPARFGATLAHCRSVLPRTVSEQLFRLVVDRLSAAKRIEARDGLLRMFGYDPFAALDEADRQWLALAEQRVRQGGLAPPDLDELLDGRQRHEALLRLLVDAGRLLMLPAEDGRRRLVFHRETVAEAKRRMCEAFPPPGAFTVSDARRALGSTRKYIVPLMEYFDGIGYTRRHGDRHAVAAGAMQETRR